VANILTPQAFSNKFDRRTPYSMQWMFNIQRELGKDLTFEGGYLGSISRHLESYRGVSAAVPGPGTVASRSPYPNFGLLVLVENGGRGEYNSLGTKLTKRYSNGLTALVSYTWSKSIDTTSGIRTSDSDTLFSQDGRCMLCDRGLSAFDNRHRLVVSGLYDVPFGKGRKMEIRNRVLDGVIGGWQVGGITTWRSGFHINPSAGVNRANTNINNDRPDATGQNVNLDTPTTDRWFNTAAFALQPIYQFGNAARNSIPGPAGFMLDSNVQKNFRITEGHEAIPLGVLQSVQPPGLGFPEYESEQSDVRPDHLHGHEHAADAVCLEIRVLADPCSLSAAGRPHPVFACVITAQDARSGSEPFPARRVAGNLYYVGSRGLASYLIATPEGHILINSGLESSVPMIEASTAKLG